MKKTESKLGKRFLAILLAMLMLLSMMPASALAADLNPDAGIQADEDPQTVDKSELEAAVQEAEALKEEDYTAESWANLQTALNAAREVLEREDAAQSDVDQALQNLNDAVDALVPVNQEEEVDKSELEAAVQEAEALKEEDYTAERWANLQPALNAARQVLEREDAAQADVDQAQQNRN